MLLLLLLFILAGCFAHSSADGPDSVTARQHSDAVLPCPRPRLGPRSRPGGTVSWTRYLNGNKVELASVGEDGKTSVLSRYDVTATADSRNSLLIRNVSSLDSVMYECNGGRVYLTVTADPDGAGPPAAGGAETWSSESCRTLVGAVGGVLAAVSVLSAVLTLRFWSRRRNEAKTRQSDAETVYAEINDGGAENPPDSTSRSTPPREPLYSTVTRPGECVYHLAQSPA